MPAPSAVERPPTAAPDAEDIAQLLAFVRDRDVACPLCGYNLRALTQPRCPECRQELALTVGARTTRLGWFIATITPSSFSGIAGCILLIPIVVVPLSGGGRAPWGIMAIDAFGLLSGVGAVLLFRHRHAFLRLPAGRQRLLAVVNWGVHVGLFLLLLAASVSGYV